MRTTPTRNTITNQTSGNTLTSSNTAGFPPAPSEAHQRSDPEKPEQRQFRIEASTRNPCEVSAAGWGDAAIVRTSSRREAHQLARSLAAYYWIEIFDEASGALIAGPFDPDQKMPTYLF